MNIKSPGNTFTISGYYIVKLGLISAYVMDTYVDVLVTTSDY